MTTAKWLERFAALVLFLWLSLSALSLAKLVTNSYNRLPEVDYWETVPHLDGYLRFPPAVLWEQHYEHRVVFPELVFGFDWLFLKGRELLPLGLILALDVGVWVLLVRAFKRRGVDYDAATWSALFLSGAVMFWPGVAFVLSFPFSLQFVMCQFAAAASFLAFGRGRYLTAIIFAAVASFSSANGLFVWPVLLALGFLFRVTRREMVRIAISGASALALFLAGYHNLGNSHPDLIRTRPVLVCGYFLSYLGMPLGAAGTASALTAGSASILLSLYLIRHFRRCGSDRPGVVLAIGVILSTYITALITSVSRLPLDRPWSAAILTPGRYVNFAAHYWAALIVLTFAAATSRTRQWLVIGAFSAAIAMTFSQSAGWIHDWMNQYALYQSATLAIESGVAVRESAQTLNLDGALVERSLPELKGRRLALYSWPETDRLGQPVTGFPNIHELPRVELSSVEPVSNGFRIIGWAHSATGRLLIVDGTDTVIGFGVHPGAGLPIGSQAPDGHESETFIAYAGPTFERTSFRLFAIR